MPNPPQSEPPSRTASLARDFPSRGDCEAARTRPSRPRLNRARRNRGPAAARSRTAPEPSLGATLIATGIVTRPKTPAIDPLAPIRRMSQAEKIAFFS